jgi:hypothetical protein
MKLIEPFALVVAVGLILAAGCVATTNKNAGKAFSNTSDFPVNATAHETPPLKVSLIVSMTGFSDSADLPVVVDTRPVGTVNRTTPLNLMVSEGNHTVRICVDSVCVQENVTARFGKYSTVDFSERLQREVAKAQPTARIIECNRNGDSLAVEVELINPSTKDHQMSVVVSSGYSYIDGRTSIKMSDSTHGMLVEDVKAGQRIIKRIDLSFANGNSISYDYPVVELTIQ